MHVAGELHGVLYGVLAPRASREDRAARGRLWSPPSPVGSDEDRLRSSTGLTGMVAKMPISCPVGPFSPNRALVQPRGIERRDLHAQCVVLAVDHIGPGDDLGLKPPWAVHEKDDTNETPRAAPGLTGRARQGSYSRVSVTGALNSGPPPAAEVIAEICTADVTPASSGKFKNRWRVQL